MGYRTQIILIILLNSTLLKSQCFYNGKRHLINDSCRSYTIKSSFERGLENLPQMGVLYKLIIENEETPITINDTLLKNEIYEIYMGKIINDTIFKNVKWLITLNYRFDTFRADILNSKTLTNLTVSGLNKSINLNIKDTNYTLKSLNLFSANEYFLDSTFLLLKNLNYLGGTFNPFNEKNTFIISKLKPHLPLFIDGVDFRKFLITEDKYSILKGRNLIFNNCKFTKHQKRLILKYTYVSII